MKEIELRTKRLTLKRIDLSDAETLFSYRSDPEICRFQNFRPGAIDHVIDFINRCSPTPNIEGSWYQLGVFFKNELIGDCGLHFLGPDNSQVEIGYTIAKPHQRQGFGEECVVNILDFLFRTLRKHRVMASLDPRNEPSMRLMEKLGFRREGWFRKSILVGANWEDDVIYALLEEEWTNRGQ
jgi:RimJ/RimL family protein N-acetyltransferase